MKKIVVIIFVFLGLLVESLGNVNTIWADSNSCSSANSQSGCVFCYFSSSTNTWVPGHDDFNSISGNNCAAGYTEPNNYNDAVSGFCSQHASSNTSQPLEFACTSQTINKGGFYCDNTGNAPKCVACDNDSATSIPNCPGGTPPFSDQGSCTQQCIVQGTNTSTCAGNNGTCKSSCSSNENSNYGLSCGFNGNVCCLPKPASDVQCTTNSGQTGINTAIGCIPIDNQSDLIGFFLKWGIGIGGGIAFLLILVAGFQIMTSRGDPNRLKAGQELMTSAIAGLLLLIFSVIILRIIGVDILQIKGL